SNDESKPVRPLLCLNKYLVLRSYARHPSIVRISFACCGLNEESSSMAMEITSRSVPGTPSAEIATDKTTQPGTPVELPDPMQSRPRRGILRMAPQLTRRNFSSRATELTGGKAIVLSVPKSVRTWIRTFLCAYFCKLHGREFTFRPFFYSEPGRPRLAFGPFLFDKRPARRLFRRFRG